MVICALMLKCVIKDTLNVTSQPQSLYKASKINFHILTYPFCKQTCRSKCGLEQILAKTCKPESIKIINNSNPNELNSWEY